MAIQHQEPTDELAVNGLGRDDVISAAALAAQAIALSLDGGTGDDAIAGGQGIETLLGGDGNDSLDGNRGNDLALMGAGDDTFVWDPGDGSDTIEGQAGADTMLFNGANGPENVDLTANGNRLRFFRDAGTITMDTAGVERVDFNALGGADTVTVNDLTATDVEDVNVDLAGTLGGATGDGSARRHRRQRHRRRRHDRRRRRRTRCERGRSRRDDPRPSRGSRERPARDQHPCGHGHRGLRRVGRRCDPALRGRRARPVEERSSEANTRGLRTGGPAASCSLSTPRPSFALYSIGLAPLVRRHGSFG